jgi:penicillin-binding protein 1C
MIQAAGAARFAALGRLARSAARRAASRAVYGARLAWLGARSPELAPAFAGALLFITAFLALDPLASYKADYSTALYADGGELLAAQTAADGQWRLAPDHGLSLSPRFTGALCAYEDRSFYGHAGFDPQAIARALFSNLSAGRVVSGGSTLSMQLARLSRPAIGRTMGAKLVELWAALRLELFHTKAELLLMYAERAPFGANVVGVEAAGFRWFGRRSQDISWAEAATLAVLPNSPGLVHPGRSRDELGRKRDALLGYLYDRGAMDEWAYRSALAEPLPLEPKPMPSLAPQLAAKARPGATETTIDFALQQRATAAAERHAARMAAQGIANLAALIVRVGDGSVASYIGNVRMAGEAGSFMVDCADAPRSSGSILKPFLYAAMLDSGELTPGRLVPDIPTRVGSYSPENNLKSYAGAVRADEALARSLNVPFVRLLRGYGVERFASLLKRQGFSTLQRAPADYGLTLVLGGAEATLADAAGAYAQLARIALGQEPKPGAQFSGVSWRAGEPATAAGLAQPPFSRAAAYLTLDALTKLGRPADEASWQEYASSLKVAWKTGTSFGSRDAWAIGVTREYAVAVWVGNASGEGRPGLKGTDAAAPLLFDLFGLLPRAPWFPEPAGALTALTVCAHSGYVAGPDCADVERVSVPAAAVVDESCPYCRTVHLSPDGLYQTRAECAGPEGYRSEKRFALPPAIEWYYRRSTVGYRPLPPWQPGCATAQEGNLEFIAPEEGGAIYVPIELDGEPGMTVFRAAHRSAAARLFWHLDGDYLGSTQGDHRMQARPSPGPHQLIIMDEAGASATRSFLVLARED